MAPVEKAPRRYVAELGGAMGLYIASVAIRAHFAAGVGDPVLRDLLVRHDFKVSPNTNNPAPATP